MTGAAALALVRAQSQLLDALVDSQSPAASTFNARGLQVYQANRAVLAAQTLASTYPVTCQLIGNESFESLARHFWRQHPPQRGDMGEWGAQLPDYLDTAPQLVEEPFLSDVARVEWALHRAATAPDAALDAASFALLGESDPARSVSLMTSPGIFTLVSVYPVVSIINAHLLGQPTMGEVAELLHGGVGEQVLVWRQGFKPRLRHLGTGEQALITALGDGMALDVALDRAGAVESGFDFNAWLIAAVQTGIVAGAGILKSVGH